MSMFLRWWLIFCISVSAFFASYAFGFIDALLAKDTTRISFGIISIYFLASAFTGWITHSVVKGNTKQQANINIGWFVTELLLAMGMIGTVIGFILMLGGSFESLNVSDTGSVKQALTDMAMGMSTALYTTLVGLVCSQLLKVQLVNVEEQ